MREPVHEVRVTIRNRLGLHTRPAKQFVQRAADFDADIFVVKDGLQVNGKSIMGLMSLIAPQGTTLTLRAEGPEAAEALRALVELVEGGFGEEVA